MQGEGMSINGDLDDIGSRGMSTPFDSISAWSNSPASSRGCLERLGFPGGTLMVWTLHQGTMPAGHMVKLPAYDKVLRPCDGLLMIALTIAGGTRRP
jgi:hypothetical protein